MNTRLHIILLRIAIVIMVTAGGLVLLSAVKTRELKPCSKVQVKYKNGRASGFVPAAEVEGVIARMVAARPVGTELGRFDLGAIERQIERHPWVYDAQLFFDNNQVLHVVLDEAVPVARAIDVAGNSFYLDERARELPVSMTYRADLPVFTNLPLRRNNESGLKITRQVCGLAKAIAADSFWMAQAAQVDVLPGGKMEMVPAIGNHIVELGDARNPDEMLYRLKLFYMALAPAGKLESYTRIQAFYNRQIVAQKADYVVAKSDGSQAMNTYQQIVTENKNVADANAVVKETGAGRLVSDAPAERKATPKPAIKPSENKAKQDGGLPVPAGKTGEKQEPGQEKKEERVPKAIMPKIEKN